METTIPTATNTLTERPIRAYFRRVKTLLFSPGQFFREEFPSMDLSDALTFGLVSGWASAVLAFAVDTLNSLLLVSLFESWVQKILAAEEGFALLGLDSTSFVWSAGFLVVAPFFYLLRLLLGALVLYVFARLLVNDEAEPVTFRAMLGLRAAAFGGQWFSVVPIFGTVLAFIANQALLVAGIRERFRVSGRRATVVVLAPYFLLFLASFFLFLFFMLLVSQLPLGELGEIWGAGDGY